MKSFITYILEGKTGVDTAIREIPRATRIAPTISPDPNNPTYSLAGSQFGLKTVSIEPQKPNTIIGGQFNPNTNTIEISDELSGPKRAQTVAHEAGHAYIAGRQAQANPNLSPQDLKQLGERGYQPNTPYKFKKDEGFARAAEVGEKTAQARSKMAGDLYKIGKEFGGFEVDTAKKALKNELSARLAGGAEWEKFTMQQPILDAGKKQGEAMAQLELSDAASVQKFKDAQKAVRGAVKQYDIAAKPNISKNVSGVEAGWNYSGVSDEDLVKQIERRLRKETRLTPKVSAPVAQKLPSPAPTPPNRLEIPKPSTTPKISKLPTLGQVADVLDIGSPGAVAIGAVVDLAKANWDAIKTTPAWAAEKMGQKVQTPDSSLLAQLKDGEEERKNTPSRYRK